MSLKSRVALVTGGSKGIGKAIVHRLVASGALVAFTYHADAAAATELVQSIGGHKVLAIEADAGDLRTNEPVVKQTIDKFGSLDIVIPNAGALVPKTLLEATEEDFDLSYAVNVKGPFFLLQKAIPHMREGSRIVLLSSSLCAASTVTPDFLLYVSSRGAVEQMARVLAKDLAKKGITVNCVAPGPTATDMFMRGKSEQLIKTIASYNPHNRLGTPEEIADAVEMLCGEGSRWVTGQVLRVTGGFV